MQTVNSALVRISLFHPTQLRPSRFKQEMKAMKATVAELKSLVAKQQAIITRQKKGMEAVTARLDQQQAQIQKVSAQFEVSKPAAQTVLNNQ
jgi:uncharacterized coiled-coil protein SlyX